MSWIKNIWNRMFPDDAEEENVQVEREEVPAAKKTAPPFRFPLIPDNEKDVFINREAAAESIKPEPAFYQEPVRIETAPRRKPTRIESSAPVWQAPKNEPKAFKKTRRFEPTRVPSPIYGFDEVRPAPIEKLLERKDVHFYPKNKVSEPELRSVEVKPVIAEQPRRQGEPIVSTPVVEEKPVIHTEPMAEEAPIFKGATVVEETPVDPDVFEAEETPVVQEQVVVEEMPATEISVELAEPNKENIPLLLEDVGMTEELTAEKEAEPHIEEPREQEVLAAGEQPMAVVEKEVHTTAAQESKQDLVEAAAPEKKREKIVPFNVLMLKSDKERLKKAVPALLRKQEEVKPTEVVQDMTPQKQSEPINHHSAHMPIEKEAEPAVYLHPDSSMLLAPEDDRKDDEWMEEQGERLIEALSHFQIQASILSIVQGPAVTQFELTVAQGVKVSKIRNLADDLKLALAAKDIRIQAPIPGKSSIGIEIPNRTSRAVRISEIIDSLVFKDSESPMEAALGLDLTGKPVTLDLRKMPHGLIAGATGSGKSVCINSLLVSLLYKSSPRDLKLLLIDPKMVELAPYNHIPHLVSPVITDVKAATASLKWAVEEMERRYQLFAHVGVRDLGRYNKMVKEKGDHAQHLPYILIIIDELADLMMMSPSDVEDAICRIAQKARACGIHLVIATQRPSVDVITGLIKSNIPTRIAFSVSSQVDSRTILDSQGAERLLGRGDMLYLGNGMSAPVRLQGTFVTDEEIEAVIAHVRKQGEPEYFFKEEELIKRNQSPAEQDDLFEEACRFIIAQGTASTSLLQRKFHIGYNRAARLMDLIEQHGFISEQNGSKARSVLITEDDMAEVFQ
ncbi:DNA translocase FtsK [Planococcus sp. YIM B11945]|uniref:DNA translocase FtsK n=1 Tax=Planococcus sp. YIM B11945 TaxID=3435410 RepID=UPI003D7EEC89